MSQQLFESISGSSKSLFEPGLIMSEKLNSGFRLMLFCGPVLVCAMSWYISPQVASVSMSLVASYILSTYSSAVPT